MRVKTCFAALAVVRDAETNSISAFNILEGVTPVGLPFFVQNASFFVLWEREQADRAEMAATFTIVSGDQTLTTQQIRINFEESMRHRTIVNVSGLVVPRPGPLRFGVEITPEIQAEYTVDVSVPAGPAQVRAQ